MAIYRDIKKMDGQTVRRTHQTADEVQLILDENKYLAENKGGARKDMKYLARIPIALYGQWAHDWRQKGGLQGTGMKCADYVLLRISTPDYSALVATPSGKTGFEKMARRIQVGYDAQQSLKTAVARPQARKRDVIFKSRG
ncbi:MAG: hypothetical protein KC933_23490 [Myxococcales bacterium]|nr:hypothetical protein [Myxococcales bacterium]